MQRSPQEKLAEFQDRYGETRTILARRGKRMMTVANNRNTVSGLLSREIAARLGKAIRARRIDRGMTMPELAGRAGLPGGKERIHAMESAMDGGMRLGTLYAVARDLDCDPYFLLPSVAEVFAAAPVAVSTEPHLVVEK